MRTRLVRAACLLLVLGFTLGPALALDEALVADVLAEIESGDLVHARELLETAEARDPLLEWVLLVAEQHAGLTPRQAVLDRGRELAIQPADLPFLRRAPRARGTARSYLEPQVREAYHAVGPTLPTETLMALSRDPERRVRRLAVSGLAEQLGLLRAQVDRGVCLEPKQQRAMSDPTLIQLLIDRLSDRDGHTDRIPADMAVRSAGSASAMHALVLIEAAALPALEEQRDRDGATGAIAAIHSAVAERLRRYPRSTWFCADGDHGRTHGLALLHCGRPLPESARYCPVCGDQVRETCAACGELLGVGQDFCPKCGSASEGEVNVPVCDQCGVAIPPQSGFCPTCGHDLRRTE